MDSSIPESQETKYARTLDNEVVVQGSKPSSVIREESILPKDEKSNTVVTGHKSDELTVQYASGSKLAILTLGVCLGLFVVSLSSKFP